MENLTLSLIQTTLFWEDAAANRLHFTKLMNRLNSTDIILLPETFSTGFTMNVNGVAEKMDGETMRWLAEESFRLEAVIGGSIIIKDAGKIYNRFIFMHPNGHYEYYDKRHLFRMGEEHLSFTQGSERLIVNWKGWKICPQICYDLRFPVWNRQQHHAEYDLLIYVANWPEARIMAWEKLLYARAIENQCYVAAINRIGLDGNGVNCSGSTLLIDPKGELMWKAKDKTEEIKTISISLKSLNKLRQKFPVGLDADQFEIK